ncbi:hypothetical protein FRACA_2450008 [Frankia canadensis]|uniref:Uncharacterized protein n=1 Tax=Frankia canadensis TaxID=1836972 RepID=A0A2I2KRU9_9ACTN|nr:hypothetical protein [Frankia canadensis]SNQ48394.1 hypothetical protein FRACA_2450008 [Frankia canadensis]SOU55684.1 hypothetical protein FRACA_2450008 [Frankia canadensis]
MGALASADTGTGFPGDFYLARVTASVSAPTALIPALVPTASPVPEHLNAADAQMHRRLPEI